MCIEVYDQKWNWKFQMKNFVVLKNLQIELTVMNTQKGSLGYWNLSNIASNKWRGWTISKFKEFQK